MMNFFDFLTKFETNIWSGSSFFMSLFSIVIIDLALAGDNAILIALSARKLPLHLRHKVIFWGTLGAVFTRIVMTLSIVELLRVPGLMLLGGIALLYIARNLMAQSKIGEETDPGKNSVIATLKNIIIADAIMGIDNTLGVAGASNGSVTLTLLGLLISVPIMVSGSGLVLKIINRFPSVVLLGTVILIFTADHMIIKEPLMQPLWGNIPMLVYVVYIASLPIVLGNTFGNKEK